jgi:DNA mismatch endonuclease (patch repair protein)
MKATRRSGTSAEQAIVDALHALDLRFETNVKVIESERFMADVVFRPQKLAVFVDGCFWHGCPIHGTTAKSNAGYWVEKIRSNQERDMRAVERLTSAGWEVLRVWAHEDPAAVARAIADRVI